MVGSGVLGLSPPPPPVVLEPLLKCCYRAGQLRPAAGGQNMSRRTGQIMEVASIFLVLDSREPEDEIGKNFGQWYAEILEKAHAFSKPQIIEPLPKDSANGSHWIQNILIINSSPH